MQNCLWNGKRPARDPRGRRGRRALKKTIMTTANCPHCQKTCPLEGICPSGHVHRIEPGIVCMCAGCGVVMTLNYDGLTFREISHEEMQKIPAPALIWAARLQACIHARKIMNRARAAANN
jgi:hypothetical protein